VYCSLGVLSDNDKLIRYFIEKWLKNPIILRGVWDYHQIEHRTNNIIVG